MDIHTQISLLIIIFLALSSYRIGTKSLNNTICLEQLIGSRKSSVACTYTPQELRTRRDWLVSLFLYGILYAIIDFLTHVDKDLTDFSKSYGFFLSILILITISICIVIPWFWISYHCAYKKMGTKWLIWTMIMLPLYELSSLAEGDYNQVTGSLRIGLVVIALGAKIFYWINCRRLYRINECR